MSDPEPFDAFYLRSRDRLLHQAYALTGDLKAAQGAVRDTFVAAWQHWRKVSRLEDPETWARPHAWAHAQRRHTARVWHREKDLDPEVQATLEALGKLTALQRRVLLLTHLASVSLPEMAREVGRTPDATTRELQVATDQFAVHRDVPSTHVAVHLRGLAQVTEGARWPRVTIVRRHGATKRRTHTVLGASVAAAAVVLAGVVATDTEGARPSLEAQSLHSFVPAERTPPPATLTGDDPAPPEDPLPESALLGAGDLDRTVGGSWRERGTHSNSIDDGQFMPCQTSRYADPQARTVWVRKLVGGDKDRRGRPASTAYLLAQLSRAERPATQALGVATDWFSGCTEPRVQLMGSWTVRGVGDEAVQMVLRDWESGGAIVVGVARTGRYLAGSVVRYRDGKPQSEADRLRHARLLARAVAGLCEQERGGRCGDGPRLVPRDASPVAEVPTMIVEADLPPVTGIDDPWVGTRTTRAKRRNAAATRCDATVFRGEVETATFRRTATRTFLVPEARLPVEFGLTESVGELPPEPARAFVQRVRDRMASCADRELGTEVTQLVDRGDAESELAVWDVVTEVSEDRTVRYSMAIGRHRGAVFQIGFIPAGDAEMVDGAFAALAERGLERLRSGTAEAR